jgi:hypothetical protein
VGQPQKGTSLGRIGANTFTGQLAEAAIYTAAKPVADAAGKYLGTKLGEGLRPVGRRIDDLLPGVNSKDEARRIKARTPLRTMTAAEMRNAPRLEQYNPDQPKAQVTKPKPKPATQTVSNTSSPSRSSGRPAPRPPVRSASPSRPAASQPGQSKDMNENYRTWAAANSKLADKVKKGQAGYNAIAKDAVSGMGPVRDSASYKPSVSSSDTASTPNKDALKTQSGMAQNFRTDVALLDKKKKKVNG